MNRIRDFVNAHGGTGQLARKLEVSPSVVSTWIKREAIPFKNWNSLVEVGASWEELLELHKEIAAA